MSNWGGLPPVDVGGWADYQRKRLQQEAAQRIAAAGAVAQDWQSKAVRSIEQIGADLTSGIQGIGPGVQEAGAAAFGGLQDLGQAAAQGVGQLAAGPERWGLPADPGQTVFQDRANAAFPDDPLAGLKYGGVQVGRGVNEAQATSQQALDAMMGFGPQGANLPAQALGALDVGTTPYTAPGRITTAATSNLGASPEQAAVAGGLVGTFGPGGIAGNLARREALPLALGGVGAAVGVGSGVAQGRPADEVISRGFEGTQMGAGAGEILPGVARAGAAGARVIGDAVADLPNVGMEAARRYGAAGVDPTLGLRQRQLTAEELAEFGGQGRGLKFAPEDVQAIRDEAAAGTMRALTPEEARAVPRPTEGGKKLRVGEANYQRLGVYASPQGPGASPDWSGRAAPEGGWIDPVTGEAVTPPTAGEYLTSPGFRYWDALTQGRDPFAKGPNQAPDLQTPWYRWDIHNAPPDAPKPGMLDRSPLPRVDWDSLLATPKGKGKNPKPFVDGATDRSTLNRVLTLYDDDDLPVEVVVGALGLPPEQAAAAIQDANRALTHIGRPYKKTPSEWGAIKAERDLPPEALRGLLDEDEIARLEAEAEAAGSQKLPGGSKYLYHSDKMGQDYIFDSAYEVVAAAKLDDDPGVGAWYKGGGKRARIRFQIDAKGRYNPNDPTTLRTGILDAGKEGIYSPDFIAERVDAAGNPTGHHAIEVKNLGGYTQPAWKVEAKANAARRVFEGEWGFPFTVWAEDQLGRTFMRDIVSGKRDDILARVAPVQRDQLVAAVGQVVRGGRGPTVDPYSRHLFDWNAESAYPPIAQDANIEVAPLMSGARAQREAHNAADASGSTFSHNGTNAIGADDTGYMVGIAPQRARTLQGHELADEFPLAQFYQENADIFRAYPEARVGTYKTADSQGRPITILDIAMRVPDGQAAAEAANLFRQQLVYNINRNINVPVDPKGWEGARAYSQEQGLERLRRILEQSRGRVAGDPGVVALPGGEFRGAPYSGVENLPVYRGLSGDTPGGAAAPTPRARRSAAGRRGAVPGVAGELPGPADRAGAVAGAGDAESVAPAVGLPQAGGLAGDGRGGPGVRGPGGRGAAGDLESGAAPGLTDRSGIANADAAQSGIAGAAGFAYTPEEEDGEEPTLEERLQRGGTLAIGGAVSSKRGRRLAAQAARDAGKVKLSDIPTILGSVPLMAPSSLGANFTGGMARTLERVAGQAFELRPVDAAVDLLAMLREVPGATRRLKANTLRGPTESAQGAMGAPAKGDLSTRGGLVPGVLTSGVRVNAATDQFWRDINEAGARAVAGRRGLGTAQANNFATRAGDFATFTGSNSYVAQKLTELKQKVNDPTANAGDRASAALATAMAPYIMMPERLLRATVLAVPEQAGAFLAAAKRGDKAAMREAGGRFLASSGALFLMKSLYDQGKLTGDPPQDANERRRREAQGEQWNSIELPGVGRVPTRYLGSAGMQANMVASVMAAAERAEAKGADPGAVWEARVNELAGWSLDNSYLSDLSDFASAVSDRRFADAFRQTAAGTLARPVPLLPGIANAADPYERQTEDFPSTVAARTGLRALAPTRVDPTTGEDQRRKGSGWSRYWGERGSVQTDEAQELARLGLQPRVLGRTEEYEGAKQTPAQRRALQRALGSETGKALRDAIKTPAYQRADDEAKKKLLQAALRSASAAADVAIGAGAARSTENEAERAWQAVPKYEGVEGNPDQIRRQNAAVARAKTAAAAAKKIGPDALDKWERENPAQADLALYKPVNPRYLEPDKESIEEKYGVKLGG